MNSESWVEGVHVAENVFGKAKREDWRIAGDDIPQRYTPITLPSCQDHSLQAMRIHNILQNLNMQSPFLCCRPRGAVRRIDEVPNYVVRCEGFGERLSGRLVFRHLDDTDGRRRRLGRGGAWVAGAGAGVGRARAGGRFDGDCGVDFLHVGLWGLVFFLVRWFFGTP